MSARAMRASLDVEIGPNSPMAQSLAVGFIMASIYAIRVATGARFSHSTPRASDTGPPHWLPRADHNDGDDDGTSHTAPFLVELFVINIIKSTCYVTYCVLCEPMACFDLLRFWSFPPAIDHNSLRPQW